MTPNARQELIKKCGRITPAYDDSFPLVDAIEGPYNVARSRRSLPSSGFVFFEKKSVRHGWLKSAHMLLTLRLVVFSWLAMLAGCIAIVPITEYVPTTTDGVVHTSNCLGAKTVRYNIDGVPVWISLDRGIDDPLQLVVGMTLAEGQVVRVPTPAIGIKPIDTHPEEMRPLPMWERKVFRFIQPRSNRLERVTVETAPAAGPILGGLPADGEDVMFGHVKAKTFVAIVSLSATPASGYRVQLPPMEINGKLHNFAPIDYQQRGRVDFMVPVNC